MEPSANRHLSLIKIFPGIRPETAQALCRASSGPQRGPDLWVDASPARVIIIVEGGADLVRGTSERTFVAEVLRPGDALQMLEDPGEETVACRSVGPSEFLDVPAERFAAARRSDAALDALVASRLAIRHEAAMRRASRCITLPVRERILEELRCLAVRADGQGLTATVTQVRLAELAGTRRESASRAVSCLLSDGALRRAGRRRYLIPG